MQPKRDEQGFGLIITLLVLLVVSMMGAALLVATASDLHVSSNYQSQSVAFYQADSGLEQTSIDFASDSTWVSEVVDLTTLSAQDPFPTQVTVNGITVTFDTEGGDVVAGFYPFGDTTTLDVGTYAREVYFPPTQIAAANATGKKVTITLPTRSTGNSGETEPANKTLRADTVVEATRLNVWDNALFANRGQLGLMVSGNAQVRGSVHIIGDPDNPTNVQWTGTSYIKNHYDGIDGTQDLGSDASKLPALPSWEYNGETVTTLDSVVRVKHGDVTLSGGADWGEGDETGNGFKETLDGFYTDGEVTTIGSATVNADETDGYDADGTVFPTLDDPYTTADGIVYGSHRDYLNAQGMTVPVSEISSDTPAFSYSDASGNRIAWNPDSGELEVEGIVLFSSDVTIGGGVGGNGNGNGNGNGGGDLGNRVEYRGAGTIYANGDINVHGDLVPVGDYLSSSGGGDSHNLGLIADRDVNIGQASWVTVMAAIYAEETTRISMQSRVAGAVVTNHYDLGNQVPRLYHVPSLGTNLPPAMPGSDPTWKISSVKIRNWHYADAS